MFSADDAKNLSKDKTARVYAVQSQQGSLRTTSIRMRDTQKLLFLLINDNKQNNKYLLPRQS